MILTGWQCRGVVIGLDGLGMRELGLVGWVFGLGVRVGCVDGDRLGG